MRFEDRRDAGRALARELKGYAGHGDAVVLALPRGGVPVGYEVAQALGLPLDALLVRKLGVPQHEELAMGALASTGAMVLTRSIIDQLNIPQAEIDRVIDRERRELQRRERLYRGARPPPRVTGRVVIIVDDGLATGATMRAAVEALRVQDPLRIVVAVPVAPPEACEELGRLADEVVCAVTPEPFWAVGSWYQDFTPTTDEEALSLLEGDDFGRDWRPHPNG